MNPEFLAQEFRNKVAALLFAMDKCLAGLIVAKLRIEVDDIEAIATASCLAADCLEAALKESSLIAEAETASDISPDDAASRALRVASARAAVEILRQEIAALRGESASARAPE